MTGEFLLNGHYQVSVFRQQLSILDVVLEYSGSDHAVERINGTGPLKSDVYLHVLSVGNLNIPNIHYKFMVSTGQNLKTISSNNIQTELLDNSQNTYLNYNDSRLQYQTHDENNDYKLSNYNWQISEVWTDCSAKCQGFAFSISKCNTKYCT